MPNDDIHDDEHVEEIVEEEEEVEESEEEAEDDPDWEAEAKKWKAIAQRNKKKVEKPVITKAEKPDDDDIRSDVESLKLSERKRTFGYEHSLSPEETDKIFQINPSPTEETLKDPFVKAGLEALRRSKRVEDNTPSSSAKSNPVFTKKFKDLSPAEKNVEWQKLMKAKGVLK